MIIHSKYIDANLSCDISDILDVTAALRIVVSGSETKITGNLKDIFENIVRDEVYTISISNTHICITTYEDEVKFYNIYGVVEQDLERYPGHLSELERYADEMILERSRRVEKLEKEGIIKKGDQVAFCDFCDNIVINNDHCEHCDSELLMPGFKA